MSWMWLAADRLTTNDLETLRDGSLTGDRANFTGVCGPAGTGPCYQAVHKTQRRKS